MDARVISAFTRVFDALLPAHDELLTTSVDIALFSALAGPIPVFSCFSADSESSIPGLTISSTHTSSFPRRICARVFASLLHSPRIEGWAERRETFGCSAEHPFGLHMTRQARRLRGALRPIARQDARERAYDAGRSPLGAPPWRFWAPGAALPSPSAPAALQRRAVALRIRAASSSHPGRSAWRAGSRASRGERLRAACRRTPLPAPPSGSSPETPLDERGCECRSTAAICSQETNANSSCQKYP